jgi:hypothetical protein
MNGFNILIADIFFLKSELIVHCYHCKNFNVTSTLGMSKSEQWCSPVHLWSLVFRMNNMRRQKQMLLTKLHRLRCFCSFINIPCPEYHRHLILLENICQRRQFKGKNKTPTNPIQIISFFPNVPFIFAKYCCFT